MCFGFFFFNLLLTYFVLLVTFTYVRRFVSYKGVFYTFAGFLSIFVGYLVNNFDSFILFFAVEDFVLSLNTVNWLALDISISLRCDALSFLFVLLVAAIGLATNLYVLNYFKYEANEDVFALLINWFMFSMMILVLANNLFTLFLGWESIGLTSFFLINFWNTRRGTIKSSFKAFFFNKISDVFLFIFLVFTHYFSYLNTLNLLNIKIFVNCLPMGEVYYTAVVCLFICTLFKSAQLIGHLWLPDSMEAPVPASALIHSATLVSAGIYLLLRFTPLVVLNNIQLWAIVIGSITAAYGGLVSSAQTDMKKLLAYSTISHCGFLFVTIGTEIYLTSIIYLFMHGLFKALTFFCAGSFIRVAGSQDTRYMGALNRILPVDTIFLIICAFNLGGMPFSLGYLYKNMLMASVVDSATYFMSIGFCFIGLLAGLVYVFRLVYYSAFDVAKEPFLPLLYEMQQKQINVVKYWSLTTIIQIVAVTFLLGFALWIYVYFMNYFVNSNLTLDHLPILISSNEWRVGAGVTFFRYFYELFYSAYLLIFMILMVVSWRVEYTYMFKLNFLVTGVLCVMFGVIWSMVL